MFFQQRESSTHSMTSGIVELSFSFLILFQFAARAMMSTSGMTSGLRGHADFDYFAQYYQLGVGIAKTYSFYLSALRDFSKKILNCQEMQADGKKLPS